MIHAALNAGPASAAFLVKLARLVQYRAGDGSAAKADTHAVVGFAATSGICRRRARVRPGLLDLRMSETNNSGDKALAAPGRRRLCSSSVLSSRARCGRAFRTAGARSVVVEKKRRTLGPGEAAPREAAAHAPRPPPPRRSRRAPPRPRRPRRQLRAAPPSARRRPRARQLRRRRAPASCLQTLTEEQRDARARALADARAREEEDRRRQEAEAAARREREAREKAEREAAEARKREEEQRRAQEAASKRIAEEEARRRLAGEAPAAPPPTPPLRRRRKPATPASAVAATATVQPRRRAPPLRRRNEGEADARQAPSGVRRPLAPMPSGKAMLPTPRPTRGAEPRNRGRLTVANATAARGGAHAFGRGLPPPHPAPEGPWPAGPKEKIAREIVLPETITIQELANRMSERAVDVIKLLMRQGQMVTITDTIDADTAQLIAEDMGHTVKRVAESDVEEGLFEHPDDDGDAGAASAGRHHHGPRRPRQDLAARRDPPRQRRRGRSRRHHAAYRRLSGDRAGRRRRSPSSTRPATRPSRRCAPAAPR